MHTERMPCEHEGRDQDDMSTSQETTKIASKPPEAAGRRGRRGGGAGKYGTVSLKVLKRNQPC